VAVTDSGELGQMSIMRVIQLLVGEFAEKRLSMRIHEAIKICLWLCVLVSPENRKGKHGVDTEKENGGWGPSVRINQDSRCCCVTLGGGGGKRENCRDKEITCKNTKNPLLRKRKKNPSEKGDLND